MKNFILLYFLTTLVYGESDFKGCGKYILKGIIRANKDTPGYSLIIHEKTKSEYKFKINIDDEFMIVPYVDKNIEVKASITHKISGFKGDVKLAKPIKDMGPNSFFLQKNDNFHLVENQDCLP